MLDRWPARVVALGIAAAALGVLAHIHQEADAPKSGARAGAPDPLATCLAPRLADIDRDAAGGILTPAQATLFKSRAEALCRAEVDKAAKRPG